MQPPRIFLDLDGVLVDFLRGIHRAMAWPYNPKRINRWDWYLDHSASLIDLSRKCGYDFWRTLEWMPDGQKILGVVEDMCPARGRILLTSCPMPNLGSYSGKTRWVYDNMGADYLDVLFITTESKEMFAKDKICLLIDDKESNCVAFEEAGGSAILVPHYHNRLRSFYEQRVGIIKEGIEQWKQQVNV